MSENEKKEEMAVEENAAEEKVEAPQEAPEETSADSVEVKEAPKADANESKSEAPKNDKRERRPRRDSKKGGRRRRRDDKPKDEFESTIVDLARVTRVMGGGKRMSFRATVVVGDGKGNVGIGVKKGADVQMAVAKATNQAKKRLLKVKKDGATITHSVVAKYKGAQVLLKPAKEGTGVIAGGAVRTVLEMAGLENVVAKIQGSSNKINNVRAVMEALRSLKTKEELEKIKAA